MITSFRHENFGAYSVEQKFKKNWDSSHWHNIQQLVIWFLLVELERQTLVLTFMNVFDTFWYSRSILTVKFVRPRRNSLMVMREFVVLKHWFHDIFYKYLSNQKLCTSLKCSAVFIFRMLYYTLISLVKKFLRTYVFKLMFETELLKYTYLT
jgi:hypothetical protein